MTQYGRSPFAEAMQRAAEHLRRQVDEQVRGAFYGFDMNRDARQLAAIKKHFPATGPIVDLVEREPKRWEVA